jgi:hypothetical protein
MARVPVIFTILIVVVMWAMITAAAKSVEEGSICSLAVMIVAELAIYVPMGSKSDDFLWARCGLFCASVPVAYLVCRRSYRAAAATFVLGLTFYACFLVPRSNLPDNFDLTAMPRSVAWLKHHMGNDARSWGIQADFSSISRIEDLGAIGPLAPSSFNEFVKMTTDERGYEGYKDSTMNLLGAYYSSYPLALYLVKKPIFDAASLRYLYLNKDYFGPGKRFDDSSLLRAPALLTVAYEDDRVEILESKEAQPRLRFCSHFLVEPDEAAIFERLQSTPSTIAGPPMLAATGRQVPASLPHEYPANVELLSFRPNSVHVRTTSTHSGLLLMNDAYAQGWHVYIDGEERPLLRVNSFFRGVYMRDGGIHEVLFSYCPLAFVRGIGMSLLVMTYLSIGLLGSVRFGRRFACVPSQFDVDAQLEWQSARLYIWTGVALALSTFALIALAYFHSS